MQDEIKSIPGFEGIYSVTSDGRVWSHPKKEARKLKKWSGYIFLHKGKWMCDGVSKFGYHVINLRINNSSRSYKVHRLVALAYIPNPLNLPEVNHKNGVKSDNRVENLEWCTRSRNQKHAFEIGLKVVAPHIGLKGVDHHMAKITSPIVKSIRNLYPTFSQKEIGEIFGLSQAHISSIVNREYWKEVV